jgi:hypothetical protein
MTERLRVAVPLDELADYLGQHNLQVTRLEQSDGLLELYCEPAVPETLTGQRPCDSDPIGSDNHTSRN